MKTANSLLILAAYLNSSAALAYQLKYFDIRGAAETCRVIFALGDEDYTDVRYKIDQSFQSPEFNEAKECGDLKVNLNRAPVLVTPEGKTIGQSKAIERYLARRYGLMGSTPEEEGMIDCIAEHCRDVKDAARQKGFSKFSRNKTDEEKAEARKEWFDNDMPTMLMKIEDALKETSEEEGYSFGSTTTYGDVAIWSLLRECLPADLEDTTKAAEKCVMLNAIADQIESNPAVSKWLKERPQSPF